MVQVKTGNLYSCIEGDIPPVVQAELIRELRYRVKDADYIIEAINKKLARQAEAQGVPARRTSWNGYENLYWPEKQQVFYTGMRSVVGTILRTHNVEFQYVDLRGKPDQDMPDLTFTMPPGKKERSYQTKTIDICLKASRGIVQAATGSGKTLMVTQLISRIATKPFLFFVHTQDLMDQAYETLKACLNTEIGRVGGDYCDIRDINVVMIQMAVHALHRNDAKFKLDEYKYDEEQEWDENTKANACKHGAEIENLIREARGVFMDECHHAASATAKELMLTAKKAYWRFGASATPFREDGAEKMLQALFGKKLVEISASWLIDHGYLVRPYILNVRIEDGKAGLWKTYQKIYKEAIVNNQQLHELTARLMTHLVNRKLPTLSLVKEYPHGEAIQKLYNAPFLRGDKSKTSRKDTIEQLRSGKIDAAIGTTLADEGLDIERLGAVICGSGGRSICRAPQRVGRIMRLFPGKRFGIAILFHHDGNYLSEHGSRVKNILKQERAFVIRNCTPSTVFDEIDRVIEENDRSENILDNIQ